QVVLNNHTGNSTNYIYAYDDEPEGPSSVSLAGVQYPVHTDGPGSLVQYINQPLGPGDVWQLSETDNALDILAERLPPTIGGIQGFVECDLNYYGVIQLPNDTTNLTMNITSPGGS